MERLVALVEAVLDEGLKYAVVLVHIAEERADVAVSAVESVRRDLKRSVGAFHASPPSGDRRVQQLSVYPLATSARLLLWIQRAARRTKSRSPLRSCPPLHCGSILRRPKHPGYSCVFRPSKTAPWWERAFTRAMTDARGPVGTRGNDAG